MHLERAHGGDDHAGGGREARGRAFDVAELLGPEVGAEARFGDHHIGQRQAEPRRHRAVAAMRDVGEGAAMDQGGRAFEGLHEVRRQRVAHERRHGAVRVEIARRHHAPALARLADDDPPQPRLQVGEVGGEAEDGHHLGGDGDVEAVLARHALPRAAEAEHQVAQRAVVHVHGAAPCHAPRVEAERVAPMEVVVEHRGKQVVGARHRVQVAGEVEVDALHRRDLRPSAARGTPLQAEAGSEGGFAQADHRPRAPRVKGIAEADRRGGLALARRGRGDAGDEHELALRRLRALLGQEVERDLRLVRAVGLQRPFGDPGARGDLRDRPQNGRARDLEVRGHALRPSL